MYPSPRPPRGKFRTTAFPRINRDHPLSLGLLTVVLPGPPAIDPVGRGNPALVSGTAAYASNVMGQAFSGTMRWESAPLLDQSKDFTVFILGIAPNTINTLCVAASCNVGSQRFWGGCNNLNTGYFSGGTGDISAGPLTPGGPFDICGVYSGGNVTTYNAGLLVTGPVTEALGALSGHVAVMGYAAGGFDWTGQLNMVAVWQRALSASEIFTLHTDPFAFLEIPQDDLFALPMFGAVVVSGPSVTLTGVEGVGSVGSFSSSISPNPPVTGVSGTGSVGTFGEAIGPTVNLVGVQGDGAVGSFSETVSLSIGLVGVQGVGSAGGFNRITAADQVDGTIFQRVAGGTTKSVPFSGTYGGTLPVTIEIKLVNIVGGATAQDWTALIETTIAGGSWSGSLSAPQGGGYHFLARSKDAGAAVIATTPLASANYWAVGDLALCVGQSNMEKMNTLSASPPTPNTNVRMYNGSWGACAGNGIIRLANTLNDGFGIPVGILPYAIGGTALHSSPVAYWMDLTAGAPYPLAVAGITGAGGDIAWILWHQGETDAFYTPVKATYKADMLTLYSRFLAAIGRSATNCRFGTACLGNLDVTANVTDAGATAIREAHLEWVNSTPGAFFAGSSVDMVRTDQYHWTAPYYERMGRRYAEAILHEAGLASYGADGMKIAYARSVMGSAVITLGISQFGGTVLKTADGGTSGAGLTGIEVSDDGFATTKTISSTAFSGSSIVVTLSAPPADIRACQVRYQYGFNPDITVVAYDNTTPGGDTLGLPLQPTDGVFNVTLKHRRSLPSLGVG